jgi:hypothetical protein
MYVALAERSRPEPRRHDRGERSIGAESGMIPDRDIWRAANLLIREHGAEAEIVVAARRADEMLERGDYEGRQSGSVSGERSLDCAAGK